MGDKFNWEKVSNPDWANVKRIGDKEIVPPPPVVVPVVEEAVEEEEVKVVDLTPKPTKTYTKKKEEKDTGKDLNPTGPMKGVTYKISEESGYWHVTGASYKIFST